MTRNEALQIVDQYVKNPNIKKHLLATEAIMRALAQKFEPGKEEDYALAGLLHDCDYQDDVPAEKQGILISEWLKEKGVELPEEVKHAMAAHNVATGVLPQTKMDWTIFGADSLTGLIVATTLVHPDKKLAGITVESILKKFHDPSFARGTRREDIQKGAQALGLSLEEFVVIGFSAMQKISHELGL